MILKNYLIITKISSLRLIIWKLIYFSQNIWRGQIGLRTPIFGQFLHFDDLQVFNYLSRKFQVWGSLYENWSILVRIFEGIRLVLEPQFLVSFFILMICKHLLTCDTNFQLEAHGMKIDLFLVDFGRVRINSGTRIFGQLLHFSNLQQYSNRR